ncbi:MAG: hypothetical protein VCF24_16055 [Candidatus Latescibacterota bacterium]
MAAESIIGPLASALAAGSILLLAATGLGGPHAVALLTLAVLIAWRFISRRTAQGYREALPEALEHRRLEGISILLEEGDMLAVLRQRLTSRRPTKYSTPSICSPARVRLRWWICSLRCSTKSTWRFDSTSCDASPTAVCWR